ncbi:MAG: YitT family protein [Tissierellia bacterium]|nr:YitT family protein [Tissierellia bacterium]
MRAQKWYKLIVSLLGLTIGVFLLAVGLVLFLEPNTIAPGGVTGFAIAFKKIINIPIYITNLLINVPLFILGVIILGKSFGWKTLYATILLSLFLKIIPERVVTTDLLLASIFGGVVSGIGLGLVFKAGGTTGGTDLAGSILNKFFPSLSTANFMMAIDILVVAFAGIVDSKVETSFYSIISLYLTVKVIDLILEGMGYLKGFLIITNKTERVSKVLMEELDRGVTLFKGIGMYSKEEKDILLCIVNRPQFTKTKEIVHSIDQEAFVMVIDISEVVGEGFEEVTNQ